MKIGDFHIQQQAKSEFVKAEYRHESVQIQVGQPQSGDHLSLSEEGLNKLSEAKGSFGVAYSEEDLRKIELLEQFISRLTGKKFKFSRVKDQDEEHSEKTVSHGNHRGQGKKIGSLRRVLDQGGGIRITSSRYYEEQETMQFSSVGKVKTSDGREIDFEVNLNMSRSYYESHEASLTIGEFHDPVVLNLDGQGAAFGDHTLRLDLNLDGKVDDFRALTQGSGILIIDHNHNGQVDDGSEVVGASTNNGFAELISHDKDGNMWIDENDALFDDLKLWIVDSEGQASLIGLKEAGVGALYLGGVDTPYQMKAGLETVGQLKHSSIYLKETGQAMMMQEIDVKI